MNALIPEDESSVEDAHEFARAALALVRAVRQDASEDDLLRQFVVLLERRLAGVRWVVHIREAKRGEWRFVGHCGLTDHDAAIVASSVNGPMPIGDAQSWSSLSPIALDRAPWPGCSSAIDAPCVVMPATFMDGQLAGCITAFDSATPALLAALEDASTLLWAVRTGGRHQMIVSEHTGQYAALADYSPDVIWRLDAHHRVVYVNRAFERAGTTPRMRLLGRHVLDCVPPVVRDEFLSALKLVSGPRGRAEFVYTIDERRFATRLASEFDGNGHVAGVVVTIRDITEPFLLEQKRLAFEVRCQVISDVSRSVIYERRLSDEVSYVSPSIETVFGHSAEEATRGGLAWWLEHIHPDDRARCAEMFAGREGSKDTQWSMEFRVGRADGSWATVLDQGRLLPATDFAPARTVGAVTDITAIRALQTQLHHAHRIEIIGRLAGGVAHDFNNVLAAIGGFTELLMQGTPAADPRTSDLKEIAALVQRASALTQNLLGLSRRKEHAQPMVIELSSSVRRLAPTLRTLLGTGVELDILPISPALKVHIDPGHMDQIVLNLAVNARDAMPDGGRVTISAVLEEPAAKPEDTARVRIDVRDHGLGIPPEVIERIFQPYFTTKPEGHGTGLGLSVVHDIVHAAGGTISVLSTPNDGTTFTVRFPLQKARVTPTSNDVVADTGDANGRTVLLIEDEESVRRSTRRILERRGYTVLEARTGDAGLALLLANRDTIDVIVSDLYMPGLSGPSLIERFLRDTPEIGCLVISGHAERFSRLNAEPGKLIVQSKPCSAVKLLGHIAELAVGTGQRRGRIA